ncbi:unnamed protein product, partial [Nesidiocoris tenuis]
MRENGRWHRHSKGVRQCGELGSDVPRPIGTFRSPPAACPACPPAGPHTRRDDSPAQLIALLRPLTLFAVTTSHRPNLQSHIALNVKRSASRFPLSAFPDYRLVVSLHRIPPNRRDNAQYFHLS